MAEDIWLVNTLNNNINWKSWNFCSLGSGHSEFNDICHFVWQSHYLLPSLHTCCRVAGAVAGPDCCKPVKRRHPGDRRHRRQNDAVQVRRREGHKRRRFPLELTVRLARNSRARNETTQVGRRSSPVCRRCTLLTLKLRTGSREIYGWHRCLPSVLSRCWLCVRKSSQSVKKLSDEVLAWLSIWSEVQMICVWSSWCHCCPIVKIQNGWTFPVPAYSGCLGKEAVKQVSVCLWLI